MQWKLSFDRFTEGFFLLVTRTMCFCFLTSHLSTGWIQRIRNGLKIRHFRCNLNKGTSFFLKKYPKMWLGSVRSKIKTKSNFVAVLPDLVWVIFPKSVKIKNQNCWKGNKIRNAHTVTLNWSCKKYGGKWFSKYFCRVRH